MLPVRRSSLSTVLLTGALAALLTGCATTFVPGGGVDVVRTAPTTDVARPDTVRPDPTRPDVDRPVASAALPGQGSILQLEVDPASISPGRAMRFRVRIAHSGYLTVSAMAPNGRVDVLVRNVPVVPGQQFVPPLDASPGERLHASAPFGTWIVRAQFTEERTEARFQNVQGYEAWTAAIAEDLRGATRASVFETRYQVEQR